MVRRSKCLASYLNLSCTASFIRVIRGCKDWESKVLLKEIVEVQILEQIHVAWVISNNARNNSFGR